MLDEREQRLTVFHAAGISVGGVEDRRGEVRVARQLVDLHSCRNSGAADFERHADRLLVGVALPRRQAMLAGEQAVVGGVDEQRVVELALSLECLDDPLDALVDGEQRFEPAAVLAGHLVGHGLRQRRQAGDRLGLSDTSASSKFGGWGSGVEEKAPMWRAAGLAVP